MQGNLHGSDVRNIMSLFSVNSQAGNPPLTKKKHMYNNIKQVKNLLLWYSLRYMAASIITSPPILPVGRIYQIFIYIQIPSETTDLL